MIDAQKAFLVIDREDGDIYAIKVFDDVEAASAYAQRLIAGCGYDPHSNGRMEWFYPDDHGYSTFVYDMHNQCCPPRLKENA